MKKHIANVKPSRLQIWTSNALIKPSGFGCNLSSYLDWYLHQQRKGMVHSQIMSDLHSIRVNMFRAHQASRSAKNGSAISKAKHQRKHHQFFGMNLWDWPRQMIVVERQMCQVLHFK